MAVKIAIVGGGYYGCEIARFLAKNSQASVFLIERENSLMSRASFFNQARVHGGYHYVRDLDTALRSRVLFNKFCQSFPFCIEPRIDHYYGIARHGSNVNALQFEGFCERIGAPFELAPRNVRRLFPEDRVSDVYRVRESSFNAYRLRDFLKAELLQTKVSLLLNHDVSKITTNSGAPARLEFKSGMHLDVDHVFICNYAALNNLLDSSGIPTLPMHYRLSELLMMESQEAINFAFTLIDGPFFSWFPFPAKKCHTISHVTYTHHRQWVGKCDSSRQSVAYDCEIFGNTVKSNKEKMLRDSSQYMPALIDTKYLGSFFEIKALLPRNRENDGRPILFERNYQGNSGIHLVLGGKIDNIFDVLDHIEKMEFL